MMDISVSTIKGFIDIVGNDEETEIKNLLEKVNERFMDFKVKVGRCDDLLLFFSLILVLVNKKENIFSNFEENLLRILKVVSINLENIKNMVSCNGFGAELIFLSLTKIRDYNNSTEKDIDTKNDIENNDESIIRLFDEIITHVKNINSEINDIL